MKILCERKLEWVKEHGGVIAPNSIPAGRTTTGETLYVGRVHHNGSLTVGKVNSSKFLNLPHLLLILYAGSTQS